MATMYPAMVNSPQTTLSSDINISQTTIGVANAGVLPDAPNLATIGTGEDAETILYTGKSGNQITGVTRGFQGVAAAWGAGTAIARYFTAYDYDSLRGNVEQLQSLMIAPEMHRNIYRGKNLGTVITEAQKAAIQAGTFDDLFIGDYWVINGVNWVIADMDYWYNCGDTAFTNHHLVIVPSTSLYTAPMNATDTTEDGYVGSLMYTEGLDQAKTTISTAFGDMLLTHRELLSNSATGAGTWFDSEVDLMSETMVYGSYIHTISGGKITSSKQQLSLFRLNPTAANIRASYWLSCVVSSSDFAYVTHNGAAHNLNASYPVGVRPVFAIG
jgi:uncharacterized protein YneR